MGLSSQNKSQEMSHWWSVIVFLLVLFDSIHSCPPNSYDSQLDGCVYLQSSASFDLAEQSCNQRGGHLVSAHNAFDNVDISQIESAAGYQRFFLGARRSYAQGPFNNVDGTQFNYQAWGPGQPLSDLCIAVQSQSQQWYTADCDQPLPSICLVRQTPTAPPPFCDITQTLNDIVFMVDGSANTEQTFGVFQLFMSNVAKGYNISSASTQIGAFTFSNQAGGASAFLLNGAGDIDSLTTKLFGLQADGQNGQNITNAISYLTQYTAQGSGYRVSSQVKHFVVYVTGSQSYTDGALDPKAAVQSMVRGGSFGFATVSLGISNPPDWLISLAGPGCSYFATDDDDLAINAGNLIQSISCYRQNICNVQ